MPRKTRKQKILSELRKHTQVVLQNPLPDPVKPPIQTQSPAKPQLASYSFQMKKEPVVTTETHTVVADYTYVHHDLIRITIFTVFALLCQGVVYFLLKRY